jgi:hypothetical protein
MECEGKCNQMRGPEGGGGNDKHHQAEKKEKRDLDVRNLSPPWPV